MPASRDLSLPTGSSGGVAAVSTGTTAPVVSDSESGHGGQGDLVGLPDPAHGHKSPGVAPYLRGRVHGGLTVTGREHWFGANVAGW
jgi:hypothetical protein